MQDNQTPDQIQELSSCLNALHLPIFWLDEAGNILDLNETAVGLLHQRRHRILEHDWFQKVLPREHRRQARTAFMRVLTGHGKALATYAAPFERNGRHQGQFLWSCERIGGRKAPAQRFVIGTDITAIQTELDSVKAKSRKFRSFFDAAPQAMVHLSLQGRILDINDRVRDWLKYEPSDLIGKHILQLPFLTFRGKRLAVSKFRQRRKGIHVSPYELPFRTADGILKVGRITGTAITSASDEHTVLLMITDISEMGTDCNLAQKFKLGVDKSADVIFITDVEGNFQYANPAFCALYGFHCSDVQGKTPRILKSGKMDTAVYKNLWKTLLDRKTYSGRMINRTVNGETVEVDFQANPILSNDGEILGFLAIQRDVSERTNIEKKLQDQQQELERKVRELEAFSRISVGRELTMIELKRRIKELEGKA